MGGLGGAGLGAAALGGASALSDEPDPEVRSHNLRRNLLLGAALGGAGGVGAGALYDHFATPENTSGPAGHLLRRMFGSKAVLGAGMGLGVGAAEDRFRNKGFPSMGYEGSLGGKSTADVGKEFQEFLDKAKSPDEHGVTELATEGGRNQARGFVKRLAGSNSVVGGLSQHPVMRWLGAHVSPGEDAAATALSTLQGSNIPMTPPAVGAKFYPSLTPGSSGPKMPGEDLIKLLSQGHPHIQADALHPGGVGSSIGRSRIGSHLGRAGVGAVTYPLLSWLFNGATAPTNP